MRRNKTWLAWALAVGLVAYLLGAATAGRSTITAGESVVGYASGTALHLDALQDGPAPDGTRLADVEVAFSAANVDSNGFAADSRLTENSVLVQPDPTDHDPETPFVGKNASARGAPLEIGLANGVPTSPGPAVLARSGATAPPDFSETNDAGLADALGPLAYASLLHSDAIARWEQPTCLTSAQLPISFGRGYAADVQLLDAGTTPEGGPFEQPVVSTDDPNPQRSVSQTNSFLYAVPNGVADHYGLVSEIHQTFAPVTVLRSVDDTGVTTAPLIIEVLGEWFVRTEVDGIGPATMTYGVTDNDPASPTFGQPIAPGASVIRISTDGGITYQGFSLNDLSPEGIIIPAAPLAEIALGEDLRALSAPGELADPETTPDLAADGTHASGAVDVVRIDALDDPLGPSLADLRIGHFESELEVPAGGFTCAKAATTTTASPTTTSTTLAPTTTTAAPTTTTTAPPGPTSTTAPPTTTTAPPPPAPPATPIRIQPKTVG